MKLHLPTRLRAAVLACFAVVSSFSTTLATGALSGGAFAVTLAALAAPQVMAASFDSITYGSDFYASAYQFSFILDDGAAANKVIAAYWGTAATKGNGANGFTLVDNGDGTFGLKLDNGYLSDTDIDADTTLTSNRGTTFDGLVLQKGVVYTVTADGITGGDGGAKATVTTVATGAEKESGTYNSNMNGNQNPPSNKVNDSFAVSGASALVWAGSDDTSDMSAFKTTSGASATTYDANSILYLDASADVSKTVSISGDVSVNAVRMYDSYTISAASAANIAATGGISVVGDETMTLSAADSNTSVNNVTAAYNGYGLAVAGGSWKLSGGVAVQSLSVDKGALTLSGAVDLSAMNFAAADGDSIGIAADGALTFADVSSINLGNLEAGTTYKIFDLATGAALEGWDALTAEQIVVNGAALNSSIYELVLQDDTFCYNMVLTELTWDGGNSGEWDFSSVCWDADGVNVAYGNDVDVVFDNSASVEVQSAIVAGKLTVTAGNTLSLTAAESSTLSVDSLNIQGNLESAFGIEVSGGVTMAEGAYWDLLSGATQSLTETQLTGVKDMEIKSGATLTLVGFTTGQNNTVSATQLSGDGTLVLKLNNNNGINFNLSNFTGGIRVEKADGQANARLQLTSSTLNPEATITLAQNGDLVFNASNYTLANDVVVEGSSTMHVNGSNVAYITSDISGAGTMTKAGGSSTLYLNGNISVSQFNATAGTVKVIGGKVKSLWTTQTADISGGYINTLNVRGGTTTISGGSSDYLRVGGAATLNIVGGHTTGQLRMSEQNTSTVNIKNGADLIITGSENGVNTSRSILISHWGYASTLLQEGGAMTAENAVVFTSWTGTGTYKVTGGTATVKGISFLAQSSQIRGSFLLGSADAGTGRVNIGSEGISKVSGTGVTVQLGNGTFGATADWIMGFDSGATSADVQLIGTVGGTVFDTMGHTITVNTTLSGAGKLVKDGEGTLDLTGVVTSTGSVVVNKGQLNMKGTGAHTLAALTVNDGGSVTVGTDATVTVTDMTLSSPITNRGTLTLDGTLAVDLSGFDPDGEGSISYVDSNGNTSDNGYRTGTYTYTLIENSGTLDDDAITSVAGTDGTYADGILTTTTPDYSTYWVNTTVDAETLQSGRKYRINGGTLNVGVDADNILQTAVGESGTMKLTVDGALRDTQSTRFGGKLSVESAATLTVGQIGASNQSVFNVDMTSLSSLDLNGGVLQMAYAAPEIRELHVTTASTYKVDDIKTGSAATRIGTMDLESALSVVTNWKSNINVDVLTGSGDLTIRQSNNSESSVSPFVIAGISDYIGKITVGASDEASRVSLSLSISDEQTLSSDMLDVVGANAVAILGGGGTYNVGNTLALGERVSLGGACAGTVAASSVTVDSELDASGLCNTADSTLSINGLTVNSGVGLTLGGIGSTVIDGTLVLNESIRAYSENITFGSDISIDLTGLSHTEDAEWDVYRLFTNSPVDLSGLTESALSDASLALAPLWEFGTDGTIRAMARVPENVLQVDPAGVVYDSATITDAMNTIRFAGGTLELGDTQVDADFVTLDTIADGTIIANGTEDSVNFSSITIREGDTLTLAQGSTNLTIIADSVSLGNGAAIVLEDGQTLDLSTYNYSSKAGEWVNLMHSVSGAGTLIVLVDATMQPGQDVTISTNVQMSQLKLNSYGNNNYTLTIDSDASLTVGSTPDGDAVPGITTDAGAAGVLIAESGATVKVDGGALSAEHIMLGHNSAGNEGFLSMTATEGGSITTGSITLNNAEDDGCTFTMDGGTLTITSTAGIGEGVVTTITGGTLVASGADGWGVTGASVGGASVSAGSVGKVTLTDVTVTGAITGNDKLVLDGTVTTTAAATVSGASVAANTVVSDASTGTLTLSDTTLNGALTGNAKLVLTGDVTATAASEVSGAAAGGLTVAADSANTVTLAGVTIMGNITGNDKLALSGTVTATANATVGGTNMVDGTVVSDASTGTLTLSDTTLNGALTGNGKLVLTGDVTATAASEVSGAAAGGLTVAADSAGVVTLAGVTITGDITGNDKLALSGTVTTTAAATVSGADVGGITVTGGEKLTLSGTSIDAVITNNGTLELDGTQNVTLAGTHATHYADVYGSTVYGDNGFMTTQDSYTLVSGTAATEGANLSWQIAGAAPTGSTSFDGKVLVVTEEDDAGKVYYINSGTVEYKTGAGCQAAEKLQLNGGLLVLSSELDTTVTTGGIVVAGSGTQLQLGTALAAGNLHIDANASVSLLGSGTLQLGTATSLDEGITLTQGDWTGTVQVAGATLSAADLSGLGVSGSTIELSGVNGSLEGGSYAAAVELTNSSAVVLGNGNAFNGGLDATGGSLTVAGKGNSISTLTMADGATLALDFTGMGLTELKNIGTDALLTVGELNAATAGGALSLSALASKELLLTMSDGQSIVLADITTNNATLSTLLSDGTSSTGTELTVEDDNGFSYTYKLETTTDGHTVVKVTAVLDQYGWVAADSDASTTADTTWTSADASGDGKWAGAVGGFYGFGEGTVTIDAAGVDAKDKEVIVSAYQHQTDYTFEGGALEAGKLAVNAGSLTLDNSSLSTETTAQLSDSGELTVNSGKELSVGTDMAVLDTATFTNAGSTTVEGIFSVDTDATVSNSGTLEVGTVDAAGAVITNIGTLAVGTGGGTIGTLAGGGTLENSGALTVETDTTLGGLTNNGTLTVQGELELTSDTTAGGTVSAASAKLKDASFDSLTTTTGDAVAGALSVDTADIAGTLTADSLSIGTYAEVGGDATLGGLTNSGILKVTGALELTGDTTAGGTVEADTAILKDAVFTSLTVDGGVQAGDLSLETGSMIAVQADSLTVKGGTVEVANDATLGALTNSGTLKVGSKLTVSSDIAAGGTVEAGTAELSDSANFDILTVAGTVSGGALSTGMLEAGALVVDSLTVTAGDALVKSDTSLEAYANTGAGTTTILGDLDIASDVEQGGAVVAGNVTVAGKAVFTSVETDTLTATAATLGGGTIDTLATDDLTVTGGTVAVGSDVSLAALDGSGTLTVAGQLELTGAATGAVSTESEELVLCVGGSSLGDVRTNTLTMAEGTVLSTEEALMSASSLTALSGDTLDIVSSDSAFEALALEADGSYAVGDYVIAANGSYTGSYNWVNTEQLDAIRYTGKSAGLVVRDGKLALAVELVTDENGNVTGNIWDTDKGNTTANGYVVPVGRDGFYTSLDYVSGVVVGSERTFDLRGADVGDSTPGNATHPEAGLLVRNLVGGGTLTIVGDGAGQDAACIFTTPGGVDGAAVKVTADNVTVNLGLPAGVAGVMAEDAEAAGATLARLSLKNRAQAVVNADSTVTGATDLEDLTQLSVAEGMTLQTGQLLGGNEAEVGGRIIVTRSGYYTGQYDDAYIGTSDGAELTLRVGGRRGLSLTAGGGTVKLLSAGEDGRVEALRVGPNPMARAEGAGSTQLVLDNTTLLADGSVEHHMTTIATEEGNFINKSTVSLALGAAETARTLNTTGTPVVLDGVVDVTDSAVKVNMIGGAATEGVLDVNTESSTDLTLARLTMAGGAISGNTVTLTGTTEMMALVNKYYTNARLDKNGAIKVDRVTDYYSRTLSDLSENGQAGVELADAALVKLNPQSDRDNYDELARVLDTLDTAVRTGDTDTADSLGASVAGASVAALGAALAGDMERQLRAIRNRTTTMGVDQTAVNQDMPYFNAWINAEGDLRSLDKDGSCAGYDLTSWGGTVGFDVDVTPQLTFGLAVTSMWGDFTAQCHEQAEGELQTNYVTAFARYGARRWVHTFVASVGMSETSLERTVSHANGTYTNEGDADGVSYGFMYEVGYVFAANEEATACLQPVVNVMLAHSSLSGFDESGSSAALSTGDVEMTTLTLGAGVRAQAVMGENLYNRASIVEARALLKVRAGDREAEAENALLAVPGSAATVTAAEMGTLGAELGVGVTVPLGAGGSAIFADASVDVGGGYTDFNGTVGYRINF